MQKTKQLGVILLALILLTVLIPTVTPDAASAKSGDYEYTVAGGKATITKYTGTGGTVTIPGKLGGYPVVSIGWYTFYDCTSLKSVTIPDSVTVIDNYAFFGCTSLKSVTLPDSVTKIGTRAFADCTSLQSVVIPDNVNAIGDYAFNGCTGLKSVTVGDGVTRIDYGVFTECAALTTITVDDENTAFSSVGGVLFNKNKTELRAYPGGKKGAYTIPNSVTSIGKQAFESCVALTGVTIPDSVTSIGDWAFSRCTALTSVTLPSSIAKIGDWAFSDCTALTSVTIPDGVNVIGWSAFWDCTKLTEITIPDSVTTIENYAFSGCSALKTLVIGKKVSLMEYGAFSRCAALTKVTLPASLKTLRDNVFSFCSALTDISVNSSNTAYTSVDGAVLSKDKKEFIIYPAGKKTGAYTIPSSVTTIKEGAFRGCKYLTKITVPKTVTTLEEYAFMECYSVESVTLPANLKTIPDALFSSCTSLKTIVIPEGVTSIGDSAFWGCKALQSVTIPGSARSIGVGVFRVETGYEQSILIPNLVISCYSGSYAHTYAKDNNIPVKLLVGYTVKFSKGSGSGSWKTLSKTEGSKVTITDKCVAAFSRKGYVFAYFLGSDGKRYKSGAKITVKSDLTLTAKYSKVSAPTAAVKSLKLTSPKSKQLKVIYKKVSGAAGYRIQYSTSKSFTKATTKTVHITKLTCTLKSLSAKKTYYVRVTAYKTDSTKAKIYSKKMATKSLKTK